MDERNTIEHLAAPSGEWVDKLPPVFETTNHDDLFVILARMRARTDVHAQDVEPLAVGLKPTSEIALNHRKAPLFASFHEALGAFIGKLKSGGA